MDVQKYAVVDPATGTEVREFPTATDEDLDAALALANDAHADWSRGSTIAQPHANPRSFATPGPWGTQHARLDGSTMTACGLPTLGWRVFWELDLEWTDTDACLICLRAARSAGGRIPAS